MKRAMIAIVATVLLLGLAGVSLSQERYGGYLLTIGYSDDLLPGDFVTLLQQDLYALGYGEFLQSEGGVTGSFGFGTYMAVLSFQKEHHLDANGIVSFQTIGALEQALFSEGGPEPVKVFPDIPILEYAGSYSARISGASPSSFDLDVIRGNSYIVALKGDIEAGIYSPYGDEMFSSQVPPLLANAIRDQIPPGYDTILYMDETMFSGNFIIKVESAKDYLQSDVEILCFRVSY